jgi:hypothetical protein
MLLDECEQAGVELHLNTSVTRSRRPSRVRAEHRPRGRHRAVAGRRHRRPVGPDAGATGFGYEVARQFGHTVLATRAGLVPLTITDQLRDLCTELSGTSVACRVSCNGHSFRENLLFTHRGLSGPAILQISSFWQPGDAVEIDLLPDHDALEWLQGRQAARPDSELKTVLAEVFTKKMAALLADAGSRLQADEAGTRRPSCATSPAGSAPGRWCPAGTEGYRTAEVTLGGVDTREVSSKTMESLQSPGLYFVGEVLDVNGHLGRLQLPVGLGVGLRGGAGRVARSDEFARRGQSTRARTRPSTRSPMTIVITAFERSPDGGKGLARDTRVRWALEEVGQPYEVRLVSFQAKQEPEHLRLHPFGLIPTYEEGDLALFETGAIVLHLADRNPGLFPTTPAGGRGRSPGCSRR